MVDDFVCWILGVIHFAEQEEMKLSLFIHSPCPERKESKSNVIQVTLAPFTGVHCLTENVLEKMQGLGS